MRHHKSPGWEPEVKQIVETDVIQRSSTIDLSTSSSATNFPFATEVSGKSWTRPRKQQF